MEKSESDSSFPKTVLLLVAILGLGAIVLALGVAYVHFSVQARLDRAYEITVKPIPIPDSPEEIARGKRLVEALAGCQDCHGRDLAGMVLYGGPLEGRIVADNLTAGEGGIGSTYQPTDWVRAMRHGVGPDGKPLVYVSSKTLYNLSDADLGAIIAYLKTIPPVDNPLPDTSVGLLSRLAILGDPSLLPAEIIDHDAPRPPAPQPGLTAEYGRYLTIACRECHGADLTGRPSLVSGGKDLTASGDLANWGEADFIRALRTGYTPEGYQLDSEMMPWRRIGQLSDDELRAIWLYLQTLTGSGE